MTPAWLIAALRAGQRITRPVALVVAHPDDEAIGLGGSMASFDRLLLVHVTDGGVGGLAAQRAAELDAAVRGRVAARAGLGAADQGVAPHMAALARDLARHLRDWRAEAVMTHPYEGGHPDHDSTAFLARAAAALCDPSPALVEMAFYHRAPFGGWRVGVFIDGPGTVVALSSAAAAAKRAMFAAHASQQDVLRQFSVTQEAFRPAPAVNFAQPPHPGPLLYEEHDWGMTGPRWREHAARATRELAGCAA